MSSKIRNTIAISVAAVAIVIIVAVIVLASIRITPFAYDNGNGQAWLSDYENVTVYYGGNQLSGTDENGKLIGKGEKSGQYSYSDLFDMMSFSLFTACLQIEYDFNLSLKDASDVNANKITVKELKSEISSATGSDAKGYTFVVTLPEKRTLKLKDDSGRSAAVIDDEGVYTYPEYDTVLFTVNESSNWVVKVNAFAYLSDDVNLSSDQTSSHRGLINSHPRLSTNTSGFLVRVLVLAAAENKARHRLCSCHRFII